MQHFGSNLSDSLGVIFFGLGFESNYLKCILNNFFQILKRKKLGTKHLCSFIVHMGHVLQYVQKVQNKVQFQ